MLRNAHITMTISHLLKYNTNEKTSQTHDRALTDSQALVSFHNVCLGLAIVVSLDEGNLRVYSVPGISPFRFDGVKPPQGYNPPRRS